MRYTTTSGFGDATAQCAGAFFTMRKIPECNSRISLWSLGRNTGGSTIDLRLRTGSSKNACSVSSSNLPRLDIFSMRTEWNGCRRYRERNNESKSTAKARN